MYDQILVAEHVRENAIEGIILPETSKEDIHFGKVCAVGEGFIQPDGSLRPLRLAVGDTVCFGMYAGIPIQMDGVEFLVMKEGEIVGRIKD